VRPLLSSLKSRRPPPRYDFRYGLPALDGFPHQRWRRLVGRQIRNPAAVRYDYPEAQGLAALRQAIAGYLRRARGLPCAAERIVVVNGSQQAIDLAARLLLDPGDAVWLEDPGYPDARYALGGAGARLVPVPVDAEGLDVRVGLERAPLPRMIYVSPSHQFPLGVTMSLSRRLALLAFAQRTGAWILEDDYDSEYRYSGRPLAALQGLDSAGRVIYVGTFSEVMFPSLRLGYVVVPPDLMDAFSKARALADKHSPLVEQAVLNDFIREGHFARHIRRTRVMYGAQQAMLVKAVQRELAGALEITSAPAGMHLVGWLPRGIDDRAVSRRLAEQQVEAPPLSAYALAPLEQGGLVLGYAGISPKQMREGVQGMKSVLTQRRSTSGRQRQAARGN
jgi:GntR family transcriptional regulator/MocR family aminotransferase